MNKPYSIKKYLSFFVKFNLFTIFLIISNLFFVDIYASTNNIDIIFLLDSSNSMNYTDPENLLTKSLDIFCKLNSNVNNRFSVIAYNDSIVKKTPFEKVDKDNLLNIINSITRTSSTDIGLGLKETLPLIKESHDSNNSPIIIMIEDGDTDVLYSQQNRSTSDSLKDVAFFITETREMNCPVYTVTINNSVDFSNSYFENISKETNGESFLIDTSLKLPETLLKIFSKTMGYRNIPLSNLIGNGEEQNIDFNIPDNDSSLGNIVLMSNSAINDTKLVYDSSKTSIIEGDNNSIINLNTLKKNNGKVFFKSSEGSEIKAFLLLKYDISTILSIPKKTLKNKNISFEAFLENNYTNSKINNEDFFNTSSGKLIINKDGTNETVIIDMKKSSNGFLADYVFSSSGTYTLKSIVNNDIFSTESEVKELIIANKSPYISKKSSFKIIENFNNSKVNLNKYFKDDDNENLTYEINGENIINASIENNILNIPSQKKGLFNISVKALDGEGGEVTNKFAINVISIVEYYFPIFVLSISGILIALIIIKFVKPSPKITGRLEGYFIYTASKNDVPILHWLPSAFKNKRRKSLKELFDLLEVNEYIKEAENIYFTPTNRDSLIIFHNTNCVIMKGDKLIPKHKKVEITFDEILYITFEDTVTEIEIKYRKLKHQKEVIQSAL